ncbi:MAG: DnaB helicase C-terminal domain-containing protein [Magnetococcus sp. YQC-3]
MSEESFTSKQPSAYDLYNSFLVNFINVEFLSNLINVLLYQSNLNVINSSEGEVSTFIKKFLVRLRKDLTNSHNLNLPVLQCRDLINTCEKILTIKNDFSSMVINYDNIFNHFSKLNNSTTTVLKNIQENRITETLEFRKKLDDILKAIQTYNKLIEVALPGLLQLGTLMEESNQGGTSPTEWLKNYTDVLHKGYSTLSSLKELSKDETLTDYMIFSDKNSVGPIVKDLMTFLGNSFKRYLTGYPVIDDSAGGIESSSVTIISGPSNHAKSIFMINIVKNILQLNEWKENDAILFVTLEDDKFKLLSRAMSIFGNINNKMVKDSYERTGTLENKNINHRINLDKFWNNKLNESIITITKNSCNLIIKHSVENSFSMNDVNIFIDKMKLEGKNIKFVAIDYIDVMQSSFSRYSSTTDDYQLHGDIVLNMRDTAKSKGVPILTISQNNRSSEDEKFQSNKNMGGSIKKIRYADLIIMINQDTKIDILDPQVLNDVNGTNLININTVNAKKEGVPFQVTITKNKNGDRDVVKWHIFSKVNLRIYHDAAIYNSELKHCEKISKMMNDELNNLEFVGSDDEQVSFDHIL